MFPVSQRGILDADRWFRSIDNELLRPTLEVFEPMLDELDRYHISQPRGWSNRPDWFSMVPQMQTQVPSVSSIPISSKFPEKYRVTVDCLGFSPQSIKTEIKDKNTLVVWACEGNKEEEQDYHVREFKKTFKLPENVDTEKLNSYMASNGLYVVEFPFKVFPKRQDDLFPRVLDNAQGGKTLEMKLLFPNNIDPSKVHVTCKERDLIIRAQDRVEKPEGISRTNYYRRTLLPENTDLEHLKCCFDSETNELTISAPVHVKLEGRNVPIEVKQQASKPSEQETKPEEKHVESEFSEEISKKSETKQPKLEREESEESQKSSKSEQKREKEVKSQESKESKEGQEELESNVRQEREGSPSKLEQKPEKQLDLEKQQQQEQERKSPTSEGEAIFKVEADVMKNEPKSKSEGELRRTELSQEEKTR